ncbi:MAG TPA: hypothetical protein VN632_07425 [Stellaceae bacterium]|nr:hypothetical protein [Stellaceae bacterium]
MPQGKSRLLVVTTRSWTAVEPFLRSLEQAGFAVALVHGQAGGHVLHDASIALFLARPLQFRHTIERVMQDLSPDLVVPTDESSFQHLREIYAMRSEAGRMRSPIARTIAKSLGDVASYDSVASGADLQAFAREHGLPVPNSVQVEDETTLRVLLESVPLPVMLKGDGGWAGSRAELVRGIDAGIAAYHRVTGATQVTKLWKEQNRLHRLSDLLQPRSRAVSLQQYIDGVPAKRLVACRDGKVLAGISVEPLDGAGPATVAKIVHHGAMNEIAAFVVRTLNLSGIVGFDFVIEHGTRQPWLLGIKPYVTDISLVATQGETTLPDALLAGFAAAPERRGADGIAPPLPFSRAPRNEPAPAALPLLPNVAAR